MMHGMEPPRPASSLGVMNRGGMAGDVPVAASAVGAAGPAAASSVNANRRVAHLLSEQKRRESINTGFEDLRQAIPVCRDGQDSKATILKRALEYIRELESVVERQHRGPLEAHALSEATAIAVRQTTRTTCAASDALQAMESAVHLAAHAT